MKETATVVMQRQREHSPKEFAERCSAFRANAQPIIDQIVKFEALRAMTMHITESGETIVGRSALSEDAENYILFLHGEIEYLRKAWFP